MTQPRVLFLCGWPIGNHGQGAASFVYEQIEALAPSVAATYVEHRFTSVAGWARRRAIGADVEEITDLWAAPIRSLRIWTPRWSPRITGRDLTQDLWRATSNIARRATQALGRIELVHAHVVLPAGLLGAGISQALGVPFVLQEHSGPFSMHLDTEAKRAAVKKTLASAQAIWAVSESLARRIQDEESTSAVRVLPNMVSTNLFRPVALPNDRGTVRIVSVGSLEAVKGFDVLLSAVELLRRSGVAFELRIVGDGSLRHELAQRITSLGLDPRQTLLGALSRTSTASVIAESHIYVCASHHETFGLAPAEALSVGRPVISTRCGGPEEYVDESRGMLVPPNDPPALADAILNLWRRIDEFDPAVLHDHIEGDFGPNAFRGRVLALYEDILQRQSQSSCQ